MVTAPHSNKAERACLGSVLLSPATFEIVDSIIGPDDFYSAQHRVIWIAMQQLAGEGVAIDHVTLGELLIRQGKLQAAGGAMYLGELTDAVATTVNCDVYANIVRDRAAMRGVLAAAQRLVGTASADKDPGKTAEAVDVVVSAADRMARTRMPASLLDMGDSVLEFYRKAEAGFSGIALPWPTINEMTMGMWPGTVTVFVARPGVGKTFVGVISGRHAWLEGHPTLVISPEMSSAEIAERFFVVDAGVNYDNVVRGTLSAWEKPKLEAAVNARKGGTGLWIMDSDDDITPQGIESAIRACKPQLVAIDSIYSLKIRGERRDRTLAAVDWMRRCSRKFGIAICAFAQQNRAAELSEKKGGGSRLGTIALADEIGQDAHNIFALEQDKDMRADRKLAFKPLKTRRGRWSRDEVVVNWDFERMDFSEAADDDDARDFKDNHQDEIPF